MLASIVQIEIHLSGLSELAPNNETKALPTARQGVVLLYPVRQKRDDEVCMGFEPQVPQNGLGFDMNFTVQRESTGTTIVVTTA